MAVTVFYSLLGVACMASSRIWAGLLDRHRSGRALATLNALLAAACVLPALSSAWPVLLLSGVVFGGVFLSVVASTTALVRHNLAPVDWPEGIAAFTTVFAAGQIVGPLVVGWIVDAFAASSRLERICRPCRRVVTRTGVLGHRAGAWRAAPATCPAAPA